MRKAAKQRRRPFSARPLCSATGNTQHCLCWLFHTKATAKLMAVLLKGIWTLIMKRGHSSARHISHHSGLHSPRMIMKWHVYHKGPLVMGIHLLGVGWRCERAWANLTLTVPDWSCLPFTPFPQSCSGSRYLVS